MKNLNVAIDINKGMLGVINDMNELNFVDGIKTLNKLYGVTLKALANHTGINYSTLRCMCNLEYKCISNANCREAIQNLKIIYISK